MPKNIIQISQLVVEPRKKKEIVEVFVSSPSYKQEQTLGRLFGIIHFLDTRSESYEITTTILQEVERKYYHGTRLDTQKDAGEKLEQALGKLNQILTDVINKNKISFDLENLSFVIGVIKDRSLHFCHHGRLKCFLIHRTAKSFQMINIVENAKDPIPQATLRKIFTNIISGKINSQDSLLFATESLTDYISLDKLKQTIVQNSATAAASHLKNLLQEINLPVFFAAIIIKLANLTIKRPQQETLPTTKIQKNKTTTLNDLVDIEDKTEKLLAPSLISLIKKYCQRIQSVLKNYLQTKKKPTRQMTLTHKKTLVQKTYQPRYKREHRKLSLVPKALLVIISIPILAIKKLSRIAVHISSLPKEKKKVINEKEQEQKPLSKKISTDSISTRISRSITKKIIQLQKQSSYFTRKKKILLALAILLIFIFFESIIIADKRKEKQQELIAYQKQTQSIENLIDQMEASMIYQDESKAKDILYKANKLAAQLSEKTEARREYKQKLIEKIQQKLQEIRHEERIADPTIVAELAGPKEPGILIKTQYFDLIRIGQNLFAIANDEIKKIDLSTDATEELPTIANKKEFKKATDLNDSILITDAEQKLYEYKNNTITPLSIITPQEHFSITDIKTYNNRLYILDNSNSQIYRLNRTGTGFGAGKNWLPIAEGLNDAVSFAIDGSIYVLKSNGEVLKFYAGEKQDFKTKSIDPPLQNPTKILTSSELKYVYILEPSAKRVVVVDKDGKLTRQYSSEKFDNLKDIVVDEAEKKIYLLNGDTVYLFSTSDK